MRTHNVWIAALLLCISLTAGGQSNRTAKTTVADVLAQMPADNQEVFNKQMGDLAAAGEEAVLLLTDMLKAPGQGSNAQAEYALGGLTAFVTAEGQEKARAVVESAYRKALDKAAVPEVKAFIADQLRLISGKPAATPLPPADAKEAQARWKQAGKSGQTHVRIAALQTLFFVSKGKETAKLLLAALKEEDKEYRNAALDFASCCADAAMYVEVIKTLPKAKPDTKVDILNWIARESKSTEKNAILKKLDIRFDLPARQVIMEQLKDRDFAVKQAAVWALTKIGNTDNIPVLAGLLTGADADVILLAKEALASFAGDIDQAVARAIPQAQDVGKIAGLQLLALRKADANMNTVLEQIKSGSPEVKAAAYAALKDVVTEKDFTLLCGMLESADAAVAVPVQEAVIAAIASQPAEARLTTLSRRMMQAGESKKHLYYTALAATGEPQVLATVTAGFKNGRGEAKDAAFAALLAWEGFEAAAELHAVCRDDSAAGYFDRALTAYIRLVSNPAFTGENRLLGLRKAMEIARTDGQKTSILHHIRQTGTYLAMLYAGEFLSEQPLREAAAQAVSNIALGNPAYTGKNVKELLAKAMQVLDNPDADYQRQAIRKHIDEMPDEEGFVSLFNGKDLTGWKGLVENPIVRAKMTPARLAKAQAEADRQMRNDWKAVNGCLVFDGTGFDNLCTEKQYGDIEMYIDWMLDPSGTEADAGIYLRGAPQVQIWDTARVKAGAQVGSGGLYNNQKHESKPLKVADNPLGEWNTFYIKMTGDRVTVFLNGEKVTDEVILENYWDRNRPIFPVEQLELQAHGSKVYYRNIYVKELPRKEPFTLSEEEQKAGFKLLFDGTNMYEWTGNTADYTMEDGTISLVPGRSSGGNLYAREEYGNFTFRFEFQLTPAANNGLGIRTPMEGDAAYVGMELQILDDGHPVYSDLEDYQYHGSVYGIIPAKRGFLKPVGEWNCQEVIADGDHIKITLNGEVITDGNIRNAVKNGTPDHKEHPGLFNTKGHIAFLGHGSPVKFRNIRILTR
ncbi:hypothetical protein Barb6_00595 [Bacteroidales bacterium Barb6]|nr:hypothetical protein Barb6_00595 [Bacteroidales bacterium Barb6]